MVTKRNTGSRAESMRLSFKNYLKEFATTVTIRKTVETKDSMNRVTATSTTTTTASADIQWITKKDLMYLNLGDVKVGDGQIFFKHNQSIDLHDELEFNNKRYRIVSEIEGEVVQGDLTYLGYQIRRNAQT